MKNILIATILLMFLSACSNKVVDVKSPCVSTINGPCGPKKPINDWWLKDYKNHRSRFNS